MAGAAPRTISHQQVVDYCRFNEVPGWDVPFFDMCVREMDQAYLTWHRQQQPIGKG